jgi:uncharacterized protein (TIGR02118 family)
MFRISVLYPAGEGKKFDLGYYTTKHMPLVETRLKSFGLLRWEVDKGVGGGAPGSDAPFVATGHLYFNAPGEFEKGIAAHGKEILGDVPNYTNIQPQIQIAEIVK